MPRSNSINGLDAFDLSPAALKGLGLTPVLISASFDSYKLTPAVKRVLPAERHAYLSVRAKKWISALKRKWPVGTFEYDETRQIVTGLRATVRAKDVATIASFPEIDWVTVRKIQGLRPKRKKPKSEELELYCVRAKVAIQIEGQTRGRQTWEDRFVLVLARSSDDAEARLEKQWIEYAKPYLNPAGYMVRWQLEKIVDVYHTFYSVIDPKETEVFSSLHERNIKPAYEWHPIHPRIG
jgi:Domain of unknown function (DUF4288)